MNQMPKSLNQMKDELFLTLVGEYESTSWWKFKKRKELRRKINSLMFFMR